MTLQQLWQAVLGELELNISKPNFTTWFKNTAISSYENGKIIIAVPNTFSLAWLQKKYHQNILKTLRQLTNNEIREILYKVEALKSMVGGSEAVSIPVKTDKTAETPVAKTMVQQVPPSKGQQFGLNPKYVFENFIVGNGNELAHAACLAVADKPGLVYNPLFIYGGVGLGKTHLLHAVAHKLLQSKPTFRVLYATCEKFTNDYINAVKTGRGKDFQDAYRNVDLFLVDDIQFITGKEGTQEAFFHTFNALHHNNKQVIITSDRPPKAIATLEARLLSRFEWGMIADVSNPDLETRMAILSQKCQEKGAVIPPDVIQYVAVNIQSNIRELEGALNRIIAHHQLHKSEITLTSTKNILSSMTGQLQKRAITPKHLINTVASFYDVEVASITGVSRKKELVNPRQIIMYLLREDLRASYPSIGDELGGRDHTTAMHAYEKISKAIENDEKLRQDIALIKQRLYS